jgi:hypothetical protein
VSYLFKAENLPFFPPFSTIFDALDGEDKKLQSAITTGNEAELVVMAEIESWVNCLNRIKR